MKKSLIVILTSVLCIILLNAFTIRNKDIQSNSCTIYIDREDTNAQYILYIDATPTILNKNNSKIDTFTITTTARWINSKVDHEIYVKESGTTYNAYSQMITVTPYSTDVTYVDFSIPFNTTSIILGANMAVTITTQPMNKLFISDVVITSAYLDGFYLALTYSGAAHITDFDANAVGLFPIKYIAPTGYDVGVYTSVSNSATVSNGVIHSRLQ